MILHLSSLSSLSPPLSVRPPSAPANGAVNISLMRAKGLRLHTLFIVSGSRRAKPKEQELIDNRGATTFGVHRDASRIGDKIGQTPPSFSHHEISFTRNTVSTARTLLDNCRCNGGSSPLDKPNQFLLKVTLPPRSFQILDAPEVIHNIFRLSEVNLRTEKENAIRSEGIKSKRRTPCIG